MLDMGSTIDGELVEPSVLAHLLKTLTCVARLLCVEMSVGRGQRDVRLRKVSHATWDYSWAGRTARTRLPVRPG